MPYLITPVRAYDPPWKTADSLAIPEKKRVRASMLGAFFASRRAMAKPWLAPIAAVRSAEITLAEKNRLFNSRKVKDLWQLFYDFRASFPRPEESDRVRSLCMSWKTKQKGHSPRVLPRFFKKHPELALWAIWVERTIHETPTGQRRTNSRKWICSENVWKFLAHLKCNAWREKGDALTNRRIRPNLRVLDPVTASPGNLGA
jgi:hypothetical protein